MSIEFDGQAVYALSCVRHIRQNFPLVPTLSGHQKKHLSLLDGIALLLVTDVKGDVAAVSFLHTKTSIEFYYAKSRPCIPQETAYVQELLKMAMSFKPSERSQWVHRALELVVTTCIKKVKGRMRKITSELKKSGVSESLQQKDIYNLPIWRETDRKGEFLKAYRNAFPLGQSVEHLSDKDIFFRYFKGLFWISGPEGQIKNVITAVWLSHFIGSTISCLGIDMSSYALIITRPRTSYSPHC